MVPLRIVRCRYVHQGMLYAAAIAGSYFLTNKFGRGVFESYVLPDVENPEMLDDCMNGIPGVVHTVCSSLKLSPQSAERR